MLYRNKLFLASAAVGATLLIVWHRNSLKKERQLTVSEERRRVNTQKAAA